MRNTSNYVSVREVKWRTGEESAKAGILAMAGELGAVRDGSIDITAFAGERCPLAVPVLKIVERLTL